MKKEASGKKGKLLWLILGLVAILVAAAVVFCIFVLPKLMNNSTEQDDGTVKLYWNIDREANTDPDTGLSIRKPADDGNYHIRFAHNGKQVEIPVADKKLVNFIDTLDLMSLTLDTNGFVVDVKAVTDVASAIGESLYVQSISGDTLIANSSITMNGRRITIKLNENIGVYNVSGKGEFVGAAIKASDLNPMDTISVYGTFVPEDSEEESVPTHIFVLKQPAQSKVYWRADQFYDSTNKVTTRVPDENGAYTIPFWVDGERVELKCKDQAVVTFIDAPAYYWCHYGLEFDEEGYIVEAIDSFIGSRTLLQCERFDITEYDPSTGDYTATNLIKNNGAFVQGTVGADCPIWEVSLKSAAEGEPCRKIDSLQLGDRVCIWTDTMGTPVLIYVAHRLVDVPAYYNVTRSWNSTTKQTSRTPNADGIYTIEMLPEGGVKTKYYTDSIELASAIDKTSDYIVGLVVDENNNIKTVYDLECLFGYTYFCRGYYITEASSTVCTFTSAAGSGYAKNGVLNLRSGPYDVSDVAGTYGEKTELRVGDLVYSCKNAVGEVVSAYITRRTMGGQFLFGNLNRKYSSSTSSTTREPDENGYYVFELLHRGNKVIGKTQDKALATKIDSYSVPATCILYDEATAKYTTDAEGNKIAKEVILTAVYDANYAYGGTKMVSRTVTAIDGDQVTIVSSSGSEFTFTLPEAAVVTNLSVTYDNFKGEVTDLRVGDYIYVYRNSGTYTDVEEIYITARETTQMAWPVDPQYDSTLAITKREPVNGWYYIDLAVDGQIKTYKTNREEVATAVDYYSTAFGILLDGDVIMGASAVSNLKGIKGTGVNNYVVTGIGDGTVEITYTLGHTDLTGTTQTLTLSAESKVIDVSGDAKKFGGYVDLQIGDTIKTYVDDDGVTQYLFVVAHCTRAGGIKSVCAHCNKEVYWNAYTNNASVVAYDTHYYLPFDVELVGKQMGVYSNSVAEDFTAVLDLNGHSMFRDGGRLALVRYGDTFDIIDSVGGGKMYTKNSTNNGGVIMVSSDGTLNIYAGTLTIEESDNAWSYSAQGGVITSSGVVNMFGGTLTGGRVVAKTSTGSKGGNINNSGTFTMKGGTITGGQANGFYINAEGAEVRYQANGGNIFNSGKTFILGGTIENGIAGRGGNVYVDAGEFTLEDGKILNGTATTTFGRTTDGRGGNICNTGAVFLKGGEVADGTTDKGYGGNLMTTGLSDSIEISGDVIVSGGVDVSGGKRTSNSIYAMYSNLIIKGGVIKNDEFANGAVIGSTGTQTGGYSTIVVSGGEIDGVIKPGGSQLNVLKDANGKDYYVSGDKNYYIVYHADGTAAYLDAENKEHALYIDYRTKIEISGGEISEVVATNPNGDEVALSGKPVIDKMTLGTAKLNLGKMSAGASIGIEGTGIFTKPLTNASSYTGYFTAITEGCEIGITGNNELKAFNPDAVTLYCEHCKAETDWLAWDGVSTIGHFFLTDNVQLTETIEVSGTLVLDLRGFTITAPAVAERSEENENLHSTNNARAFTVAGTLAILDTSENETGVITGGTAHRGGNIYVEASGTFELYGGSIVGGIADNDLNSFTQNAEGEWVQGDTGGRGGNIFGNGGAVLLYGGSVIDGSTNGGSNWGGNIFMTGGLLFVEDGVLISGGTSATGANVYLMYASMVMNGGEIKEGNSATGNGIYIRGSGDKLSSLEINGGIVNGTVQNYEAGSTITVSGTAQIAELKLKGMLIVGELTEGASIALDAKGTFTTAFETAEAAQAAAAYFLFGDTNKYEIVVTDNNELAIEAIKMDVNTMDLYCDHCGETVTFYAWNGYEFFDGGHYFLEGDLQLTSTTTIGKDMDVIINLNGYTITAAENTRAFYVDGGILRIVDSSENETGMITGGRATRGGNVYVAGGDFYLYSGTIANGVADNALGTSTTNGRGGNIFSFSDVYILGGKVIGGSTVGGSNMGGNIMITGLDAELVIGENAYIADGKIGSTANNIYMVYSNLIIEGGEIRNGAISATGTSTGGYCTITIKGGIIDTTIVLGGSTDAGAKYPDYRTVLVVEGGQITKIDASKVFDNKITISGAPVIGELILGENTMIEVGEMAEGASITVDAAARVISNVVANADVAAYFAIADEAYIVTVNAENKLQIVEIATEPDPEQPTPEPEPTPDGDVKTIFCAHCNQNVEFTKYELVLSESGEHYTANSGHYFLAEDLNLDKQIAFGSNKDVVVDLNGKTVTADGQHRAFNVSGGATLTLQGAGTITGGSSTGRGGNIYASGANLNLFGDIAIYGGNCPCDGNMEGNNVAVYNGKFVMNGNVVIGNAADVEKAGYSLYLMNLTAVEMTQGTVIGRALLRGEYTTELRAAVIIDMVASRGVKFSAVEERTGEKIAVKFTNAAGDFLEGAFTTALDNAEAAMNYFVVASADQMLVNNEGVLEIKNIPTEPDPEPTPDPEQPAQPTNCACGCGALASEVVWVDANAFFAVWGDGYTALPNETDEDKAARTARRTFVEDIHLKLSADLDITAVYGGAVQIAIGGNDDIVVNVTIDLNGFTWSSNNRLYNYKSCTTTLMDSSAEGTGVFTSTGNSGSGRAIINYGTFNILSGTITMTEENAATIATAGVYYHSAGTTNMYGGKIVDGRADGASGKGGNVNIRTGTFNLYGGEISGGEAAEGSNVYVQKNGTLNIVGGTIADQETTVYYAQ